MKSTSSQPRCRRTTSLALPLALLASSCLFAPQSNANLFVDLSAVPLGGGGYEYAASVSNTGPDDVAIVSLVDAPVNDALINPSLVAPAGFQSSYDPGLGFLDFLADLSFAAGTTVDGFTFQSASAPLSAFNFFEALTVNGDPLSGQVRFRGSAVPDTGRPLTALGLGIAALAVARRWVVRA